MPKDQHKLLNRKVVYRTLLVVITIAVLAYLLMFALSLPRSESYHHQANVGLYTDNVNNTNGAYRAEIAFGGGGDADLRFHEMHVVAYSESCDVLTKYYLPEVNNVVSLQSHSEITIYTEEQPAYIVLQSPTIGNLSDETDTLWRVKNQVIRDNGSAARYEIEVYEADEMQYKPFPTEEQLNDLDVASTGSEQCLTGAG